MGKNQTIIINADVIATLKGMDKVVTGLKSGLSEANTKIDFTKGIGASVSKLVDKFKNEFSKFNQLTENGKLDIGNTKEALKSGKNLIDAYKELQRIIGDLNSLTVIDAKKLFPDAFDQRVENASKKLKDFSNNWSKISEKQLKLDQAKTELQVLTDKLKELEKSLVDTNTLKVNTTSADQKVEEMTNKVKELKNEFKKELKLKVDTTDKDLIKNKRNRDNLQEKLNRANSSGNINTAGRSVRYKGATLSEWEKGIGKASNASSQQKAGAIKALQNYSNITKELDAVNKKIKEQEKELENFKTAWASFDNIADEKLGKELAKMGFSTDEITQIQKAINDTNIAISEQTNARQKLAEAETENARIEKEMSKTNSGITQKTQEIKQLEQAVENLQTKVGVEGLKKVLKDALDIDISDDLLKSEQGLESLKNQLNELDNKSLSELIEKLSDMGINTEQAKQYVEQLTGTMVELGDSAKDINRANQEMEQLKNQVLQFFSIGNAVQLFKRAVKSAFDTVKELDATMTETAVVTDFTISDMWEQLPTYAAEANKLGAAINDLYSSTTLYYQQGLQTKAAMALGIETTKMARIANIEAADATNLMTAALRGFNMELNETSAQKVNDIYSELAAITAADTQEIGVAMSKTASIASSANMELETTAALLSQIIETTREAPETAGTAMKTIIARFSEVKELVSQGQLTGEDTEGEIIDVNKIQGALRSVGISMKEFFAGTEGLDDVLLKLASKWDTLDFTTQRYIATTAAGSRQQSRFIAMMSDYSRTQELVSAAYNSAGASQEQFEKTLDSLDAKLTKLKNAWDQFAMGLANNEFIKGVIDVLTFLLNTLNSIIDTISGGNGIIKSLTSLGIAFSVFKGIKSLLNGSKFGGSIISNLFGGKGKAEAEAGQIGRQAGNSFVINFKKQIQNVKDKGLFKGLFSKNMAIELKEGADFSQVYNGLDNAQKLALQKNKQFKDSYLSSIQSINSQFSNSQLLNIQMEYDTNGIDAANAKVRELGGNIQTTEKMVDAASQTMSTDFGAVANAAGVAGAAIMGMASVLEANGASKELIEVIKAIGIALVALPTIFKIVSAAAKVFSIEVSASIMNIPIIGWIAAVISALIALASILSSAIETGSEKMKRLSEETNRAKETAEAASNAYSELKDSLSGIDEANKTLDNLVYGTQAWTEALLKVNEQVLDLITLYPQLMKYVTQGEYGQLEIRAEGTEELLRQQLEGVKNARQSQLITTAIEAQSKVPTKDKILYDINVGNKGITETVYNGSDIQTTTKYLDAEDIFNQISSFVKDNPLEMVKIANEEYSDAIYKAADAVGLGVETFAGLAKIIPSFNITESQVQSSIANIIKLDLSEASKQSKYVNQVVGGLNKGYSENIEQDVIDKKNTLTGKDSKINISSLAKELQGKGYDITSTDRNLETYQQVFAVLTGRTTSDVKEAGYSQDQLATMIAEIQLGNEYAANTEEIIAKIDQLAVIDKAAADKAAAVLSNDFSNLTQKQIEELQGLETGEDLKQALMDWGFTEEELNNLLDKLGVADFDALNEKIQDTAVGTLKQFSTLISDNFTGKNAEKANELIEGRTYGEAQSITDALNNAEAKGGDVAFDSLSSIITQLNNADIDEEEYRTLLESLSSYDFSDPDQIEAFLDRIKEIAPNLPTSELDKWKKSLTESYRAVKTFSLENLRDELKNSLDLIDDIKDRDNVKFNDEEYQQLISADADKNDFIWDGQDWVYIGGTMEELASILEANTSAVLENTIALFKNQIESGSQFNEGYQILEQSGAYSDTELELFRTGGFTNASDIASMYESMGIDSIMDAKTGNYLNIAELLRLDGGDDRLVELYQAQANDATNLISNAEKLKDIEGIIGGLDNQIAASISQAEDAGLNINEMMQYADALRQVHTELDEVTAVQVALANSKMNAGLGEIIDSYDEWSAVIDKDTGKLKDFSAEGVATYNNLKASVNKMLNTSTDLSNAFWDNAENMKNIEKAAKGDTKALGELQKAATQDYLINLALDPNFDEDARNAILTLSDFIMDTDLPALKAGVELTGQEDFITRCNELIKVSGMTAEQVSNAFKSMGYDVEFDPNPQPVTQVQAVPVTTYSVSGSMEDGSFKMEPTVEIKEIPYESSVAAPTIKTLTSTGSGGGGVSISNSSAAKSNKGGGGGGGGGSKEDTKTWKNPYDQFYNTTEKINELLRDRNKLEREYDRLLSRNSTTVEQLNKNLEKQLKNLEDQIKSQKILLSGKRRQLINAKNATMEVAEGRAISFQQKYQEAGGTGDISQYAYYDENLGQVVINWDKLEALQAKDAEQGEAVEAYISYLEGIAGDFEDAQDALSDIEDSITEIINQQLEERVDFIETMRDLLVEQYQKRIDELSSLNDTINDSNQKILDGISESIELERQIRDNTETEEDIADKEARLAYLRRDTSGANDLEIMQLEEELADMREGYSDTLIDQEIDRLARQNDEAAEARQRQIEIMQAQLDYWQSSDYFNNLIESMDKNEATALWKELKDFEYKTEAEKIALMKEFNEFWNRGSAGSKELAAADSMYQGTQYTLTDAKGNTYTVSWNGTAWVGTDKNGNTFSISQSDIDGANIDDKTLTTSLDLTNGNPGGGGGEGGTGGSTQPTETYPYGKASETSGNIKQGAKGNAVKAIQYALNKLGYGNSGTSSVDGIFGPKTTEAVKAFQKAMDIKQDGIVGNRTREKFRAKQYLTGGLADYTGLAWLDGSKSKPELVLNAKDTENFIVLKDILSDVLKGGLSRTKNSGDNYYDFYITVEEIANDYDVEKMIQKIKEEIHKDSTYRNVNSIHLLR